MVITAAACFAYVGSLEQWPQQIATMVTESGLTGISFLLLVNLTFLIAGMFMDVPMALALLVPLFGPAAVAQGVHPVHLGIMLCLNLTMGLITPPLGGCLIVVSAISGENYWVLARAIFPFIVVELTVLLVVTYFPSLSLLLPRALGFI